jgi:SpoVK/Ycf46/Vps4 family AAA+-type ATPase
MVLAFTKGDAAAFRRAAEDFVTEEKRKKHHILAKEIERILNNNSRTDAIIKKEFTELGGYSSELPRDKERGIILVEVIEPRKDFDDLILSEEVYNILLGVITENRYGDLLRTYGLKPANRILFCGPPGCGKTVTTEVVATTLRLPMVLVRFDAVVSSYLGETAANLRKVFDFAYTRPMVLLFDEFDAIGKHRSAEDEHGELKRVVNSFLQMLDNFRGDAIIVAATNHQGLLDPALWRRFDDILFFNKPSWKEIYRVFIANFRQIGISPNIDLEPIAKKLIGASHADIERIAIDAIKSTVLEQDDRINEHVLEVAIERYFSRARITTEYSRRSDKG